MTGSTGRHRRTPPRRTSGGCARYVGRVGALAVVMGVGAAVGVTPGVAWAQEGAEASATGTAAQEATAKQDPADSATRDQNANIRADGDAADVTRESGGEASDDQVDDDEISDGEVSDDEITDDQAGIEPVDAETPESPESPETDQASGDLTERGTAHDGDNAVDAHSTTEAEHVPATEPVADHVEVEPTPPPAPAQAAAPSPLAPILLAARSAPKSSAVQTMSMPTGMVISVLTTLSDEALSPFAGTSPKAPALSPVLWAVLSWTRRELDRWVKVLTPAARQTSSGQLLERDLSATTALRSLAAPAAAAPPPGLVSTIGVVVTTTLQLLSDLLGSLLGVNRAPTVAPTISSPDPVSGVVTGNLNARDPNSRDTLTYSATTTPTYGTLAITPTGAFTYTPSPRPNAQANPVIDSFAITVSDGRGGQATATFTNVPARPANRAPSSGGFTATAPTGPGAAVTGTVTATDPDGDTLVYSGPAASARGGAVQVTPAGAFTYMPTTSLRETAISGGSAAQDTFSVNVSDGRGGTRAITVTVAIAPPNRPPANPVVTVGQPDPGTGNVPITVTTTDPDGDPVILAVTRQPDAGTLTVGPGGTVTFDPDPDVQVTTTPGGRVTTGEVTATDGSGGATVIPITNIPVAPIATSTFPTAAGDSPQWVAFSAAGDKAYIVNQAAGTVTVVDTGTKAVVTTLHTGTGTGTRPTYAALGPDNRIYVTNQAAGTVSVIDTGNDTIVRTITTGGTPIGITFDQSGLGYVATGTGNSIVVFDTKNNYQQVRTYTAGVSGPTMAAVSPEGRLYVVNQIPNSVNGNLTVLDANTGQILKVTSLGNHPTIIAFDEADHRAYVTVEFQNRVAVFDTATDTFLGNITVGTTPIGIQIDDAKNRGYVVNFAGLNPGAQNQGSVSIVNLDTKTEIGKVPAGNGAVGATITPDGKFLWVVNQSGSVTVIAL